MNPCLRPRTGCSYIGINADKVILYSATLKEFGIIEVPDHAVMFKILKEHRNPVLGVRPNGEIDCSLVNFRPDLQVVLLWVIHDDIPRGASAIIGHCGVVGPHVDSFVGSVPPLIGVDDAVEARRGPLAGNEGSVELGQREGFVPKLRWVMKGLLRNLFMNKTIGLTFQ